MYLNEQYAMYQMAYNLVEDNGYELLHIDSHTNEIWMEKHEKKVSKVIRIVHNGFDWKNHFKRDIAVVFQKTKAMKKLLAGKQVELFNVYVAGSHIPVDDWDILKKPMQLNEKNPIKMNVFYLSEHDFDNEKERFEKAIGIPSFEIIKEYSEAAKENKITFYKSYLEKSQQKKKKEEEEVFTFGKPILTYILLAVNVFIFILLELNGGSTDTETLIKYGAKYNPDIIDGEWWRLISSMFLHIGLVHIIMNMIAVYYLGVMVERIYGSWRFLFIYFMAGIGGSLASFAFTTNVSAGASGALFGLFGALLFFGLIYKKIFFQTMGKSVLIIIGINIVFGFTVQQIDISAHLGGLTAGFVASAVFHLPKKKNYRIQFLALLVYAALLFGLVTYGIQNNMNSDAYQLTKIEDLIKEENYEEVIHIATDALEEPGPLDSHLLFQRSYAYIEQNKIDLAIDDLEKSISLKDDLPEAYYNLALLYYNTGQEKKAIDKIKKAYKMKPEDESFTDLYEKIIGESP